jgi:hypothetical protein
VVLLEGSGQVPDDTSSAPKLASETEEDAHHALKAVALSHTQVEKNSSQSMATALTQVCSCHTLDLMLVSESTAGRTRST